MSQPIAVALVGYGFAGRVFHAPLIAATDGVRLHTIVSRQTEAVAAAWPDVQRCADLESALADPAVDLVVIATPNVHHAAQAAAALTAGKHVVVDKPFTLTVREAASVIRVANDAGRLLSVFHNRRYDSDFLTLQSVLREGLLGDVVQVESRFDRFRPEVRDRWRERDDPGAGVWYDLGPHLIDQALQLFGMPIGITTDLARHRPGALVDDAFTAILRYDRRRVLLQASSVAAEHDLRFAVHGMAGSFVKHGADPQEAALKAGGSPRDSGWGDDPRPGVITTIVGEQRASRPVASVPGDYGRYYAAIRDAIHGVGMNPVAPADALAVMCLLEAGRESAATHREVAPVMHTPS
jgi:predicted dehydrogenase